MSGSGINRELTRTQRVEELERRTLALTDEVVKIGGFLEKFSRHVNAEIAWLRLPWWRVTHSTAPPRPREAGT